jgi:putative aldouronate transport system substrate-binding protein
MQEPVLEEGELFHFGDTRVGSAATGKNVAISECCENVDLALAWLDFWFTKEGQDLANYGIEDQSFTYDEDGNPVFTDLVLHNDEFPMISFATTYYTIACVATLQDYDRIFSAYSEANLNAMDLWTATSDDLYTLPSQVELDSDESTEYSDKWSDISTYASTEVFKFVMGEYNFDSDWDAFVAQLEDMGLNDCIALYQDAYDRYVEAYGA